MFSQDIYTGWAGQLQPSLFIPYEGRCQLEGISLLVTNDKKGSLKG